MATLRAVRIRREVKIDLRRSQESYARALLDGHAESAGMVIEELQLRKCSLDQIYSEVIAPALVNVGDSWCSGAIGVGQEHLATQIVLTHMDRLIALFAAEVQRTPYRVLVSCAQGELHYVGARMFADLCLIQGWTVDFLGPDVPNEALVDMVKQRRPQLVALSVTMEQGMKPMRRLISALASLEVAPKVILGGQASISNRSLKDLSGRCEIARDALDGMDIASRLFRANRPKTVLKEYLLKLGHRVRDLRTRVGWTQEHLAEATRVTRVCIVAVEGGKQNISMDIVVRLANALGISPENLLVGDDDSSRASREGV
jgi:methanogenic corrinoid protein MtbC1/DNA-binding XRE family transcriptional regulator